MAKKKEKGERRIPVMHAHAAGMDIGAEEIYVAVPDDPMRSRCVASARLPAICTPWLIGYSGAASTRWRWNRLVSIGSPFFKSWNRGVSVLRKWLSTYLPARYEVAFQLLHRCMKPNEMKAGDVLQS